MEVVSVVKYLSRCTQLLLPQQRADVQQGASSPAHWLFTQHRVLFPQCRLEGVMVYCSDCQRWGSDPGERLHLDQTQNTVWLQLLRNHVFTWLTGNKLHMELNWKIQYYYIIMIILIIIIIIIIHSVDRMNWDRRCHSCLKLNLFY